jgi:hypothetical protein
VLGCGLDAEHVLAHPLLHAGELVPSEPDRPYPSAEVLAVVDDVAWRGGQRATGSEVLSGEVEGVLLFASLLRQGPRADGTGRPSTRRL